MTDGSGKTGVGDVTPDEAPVTPVRDEPGTLVGEWQRACTGPPPVRDGASTTGATPLSARQDWPMGAAVAVVQAIDNAAEAVEVATVPVAATDATGRAQGGDGAHSGEAGMTELSRAATGWALAHGSAVVMRDRLEVLEGLLARDASTNGQARHDACQQLTALATRCSLERLEQAALVDPLTGAGNRRALETMLSRTIASAQRFGYELAVVTIDLDGLKAINDTYGHDAGDAALTSLVNTFTATLREVDAIFRTGGDEFVVVLPGASADDVASVMTRVAGLGAPSFSWGSVAWNPDSDLRAEELLAVADMNLYSRRKTQRRTAKRTRSYHRLRLATVAAALVLVSGALVDHGIASPPTALPHHTPAPSLRGGGSQVAPRGAGGNPANHPDGPPVPVSGTSSGTGTESAGSQSGAVVATELASDTGSVSNDAATGTVTTPSSGSSAAPTGASSPPGAGGSTMPGPNSPGGSGAPPAHLGQAPSPARSPGANHPGASHLGASHPGASHPGANHLGASHPGANHLGANHLGGHAPTPAGVATVATVAALAGGAAHEVPAAVRDIAALAAKLVGGSAP
ncbi:MAG: diguanylate cyclase [Actinomycetota bacterium]|jgi:diguanylate cyclase (GGDEF)-like protein|nr:diguanylate cyclase [Actinomycetota bacterium]